MNEVEEESDTVRCPYEPGHGNILKSRIQTHLVKCAENHKHLKMARCPFNSIHVMTHQELENHISICDKRPKVNDEEVSQSSSKPGRNMVETNPIEEPQEWDQETPATSYLDVVQDEEQNPNVVRCLMLASKGEKKKFKHTQRMRARRN